ncbi:MAG TPA: efflux RND transporter periplasmic adaptor subunit [Haliangium sp.]|nr:efflux RND transporter periplasmic adaptor subunit [Haliangium sp.]
MSNDLSADLASLKIDRDRPPSRGGPTRLALILGVLAAIGGGVYVAIPYVKSRAFKREVEVTEIALISPAQAQVELTSTGYVKPQTTSLVTSKVTGKISKVHVTQGARVNAGDVLFELEVSDQKAEIAAQQALVAASRARAQTARANLAEIELQAGRAASLAEQGVRPGSQAEDLAARAKAAAEQVRAADAEVRASQASVNALGVTLDSYTVRAPISGTVLSDPPEIGELIGPALGASAASGVIEIADLDSLMVETDVPEGRLHMVKIGGPCEIVLDAFPGKRYRCTAREIVPRVDRAKATVTVKVGFTDPADGVLPDMSARVSFLTQELDAEAIKAPPKLVVPRAAVVERSGAKVVYVVDDGRVRMTPITIAGSDTGSGSVIELQSGPSAGTRVVKNPPADLRDGQEIKETL